MKYFSNINNADELRKAYRAMCLTMHPDRGGNEEEFKAMLAEFETLKKQYQNGTSREQYAHTETAEERARRQAEEQREREEWARWEAEEKRRREQEEREKAERIRKAQEENRAAVRAWAAILERVAADATGQKARFYRFADKKEAAAFVAATKRNITKVINHYFPGLKVKITISGEIWREKFIISWEDGPSEKQLRDTCKELAFFIPSSYCCAGPTDDYGHYEERDSTEPWREAYGQALGDTDDFETARTLSEEGKQQAEEMAARYFANFDPKSDAPKFAANLQELINFAKAAKFYDTYKITEIFRYLTGNYYGDMYGNCESITGEINRRELGKMLAERVAVTVSDEEKAARRAAKFCPRYGKALKSLQQLTGVGTTNDGEPVVFFCTENNSRHRLSITEAVERLERGEAVSFGTEHTGADGGKWYWCKFAGGYKTQDKRAAKFAAAGLTIRGHVSPNSFISLHGISPEFAAAIREDLADVDRQREAWESKQNGTQQANTKQESTEADTQNADSASETSTDAHDIDDPTAAGLQLIDTAEGVAVIGTADNEKARGRQTYKARKAIKAHGATWNKTAARWEATDPADVARLRAWFALREQDEPTATAQDEPQAAQSEPTTNEPTADTANEPTADQPRDISPLLSAVADLLRTFGEIMEQAKQWEGVTVPAATLERWKQEANDGTKTAAARLCEVCACLASLTPESRKDFDALGGIFWSLSEQLKQGTDPATLQGATDYARAQLFDLIDRTQTANQANRLREVLDPDSNPRREAA